MQGGKTLTLNPPLFLEESATRGRTVQQPGWDWLRWEFTISKRAVRQTWATRLHSSDGVSAAHHPPTLERVRRFQLLGKALAGKALLAAGGRNREASSKGQRVVEGHCLPESIQRIFCIDIGFPYCMVPVWKIQIQQHVQRLLSGSICLAKVHPQRISDWLGDLSLVWLSESCASVRSKELYVRSLDKPDFFFFFLHSHTGMPEIQHSARMQSALHKVQVTLSAILVYYLKVLRIFWWLW